MNKYTIAYQYGPYSGTETVWADDEDEAIETMWRSLRSYMTLGAAYQSASVKDVVYG